VRPFYLLLSCLFVFAGCDSGKAEREREKARLEEAERSAREYAAAQKAITEMNHRLFAPRPTSKPEEPTKK
jgi:hypothetical protein